MSGVICPWTADPIDFGFFTTRRPLVIWWACAFVPTLLNIYHQAGYREGIPSPICLLLLIEVIHCKIMCDVQWITAVIMLFSHWCLLRQYCD
jgi:hypothetical protein